MVIDAKMSTFRVSLDPQTKKLVHPSRSSHRSELICDRPIHTPAIEVTNPEEEAIYKKGEARSKHKKALAARSLRSHHPDPIEAALIHRIWQFQVASHDPNDPARVPSSMTAMSDTKLQTASIMQPQYRNRHNFMIFGGFLLKQTFELAFCCCASFAHTRRE